MNPKQRLEKDCDKLFADIVKLRAKGKCQIKGCARSGSHAHHIARRGGNVRWFLDNGICLCVFHHDHDFEGWMDFAIIETIGITKFSELQVMSREVRQWKEWELEDLKVTLAEILSYYKENP